MHELCLNAHLLGASTRELLARSYLKAPVGQLVVSGTAQTRGVLMKATKIKGKTSSFGVFTCGERT